MQDSYVLRNLKLVDGRTADIAIADGRIAEIADAGAGQGKASRDCAGLYVSAGWIDMHVHAFEAFEPYGDEIDEIGVRSGATTIIDAGSCGADRIDELADHARRARTNVRALLNVSRIGLSRMDELSRMEWLDPDAAADAVGRHRGFVVGVKARVSRSVVGHNGLAPLRSALAMAERTGLPLMAHVGSGPPDISSILDLLREGDIVTHYLHGKKNKLFDDEGRPLQAVLGALGRGVRLDVGHGTASFSFRVAEAAKRHGVHPGTISTDIYRGNRLNGPVHSISSVLTKFLTMGYTLEEVVGAVTWRAAEWLAEPELGRIRVGEAANLTLFAVEDAHDRPVRLIDSEGDARYAHRIISAKGVVKGGAYLPCEVRAEEGH